MKVKVSDFIAQWLVAHGIHCNFSVTGGGAMHLNASLGHQVGLKCIYMQHEQAAAMAAEAYYRMNNELPVICCTTGPGGTNTLTGVLGAWLDSIPMLIISGQVKYSATVRSTGYPMRIFGDQEFDITETVKPMTKYAQMVTRPEMIQYHLDKALFLALHGRPGPVWIDIPLNIQWGYVDTEDLVSYSEEDINSVPRAVSEKTLDLIIEKIKTARRPALLAGIELRTNNAYGEFRTLIEKLNIPVVTSFDSIDLIEETNPLYAGRAGDVGNRFGNWVVQNSDCLLVLGSRLGIRQVSYATETWARAAFVIHVYPDSLEITKPNIHVELPVRADLKDFAAALSEKISSPLSKNETWFSICASWKEKYPVVDMARHYVAGELANAYCFMNELSKLAPENIPVVSANGSACVVGGSAFLIKRGQRFIINSGCASMGYELPAAIGACFASNKHETYCFAGDGSIVMNLQELQTIVFHKLPVKIFLINNQGYHSIRQSQRNLFKELTECGVGPESGDLSFPDMHKVADAFDIPYRAIHNNQEMAEKLSEFIQIDGYALCEIFVDTNQVFEPKPSTMKKADGTLFSPPLEDLAPFLPREELKNLMLIPLVGEEE